jgi:hypothetical protein
MKKDLKIVMETSYNDETGETYIKTSDTKVFVGDEQIGCIQYIKIDASAMETVSRVEIAFPKPEQFSHFSNAINHYIRLVSDIEHVDVKTIDIKEIKETRVVNLREISTDGVIDTVEI